MSPLLRALGVGLDVREGDSVRPVLEAIDLELRAGELVVVRGPSGSGKTSLLAVLGGLSTPTRGDVLVEERSIVRMRDHHRTALRRRTIGFVVQDLALLPDASVLENVLLPFVPDGVAEADEAHALALLARFGLGGRERTRAAALSGGEKQRVALARALAREPKILLLDEPTAHVDASTAESLVDELARLRDEGRGLVVATHDPRVLEDPRIDRILALDRGRLSSPASVPQNS